MNEKLIGITIIMVAAVIPCFVFGYLIVCKKCHSLIAGWDAARLTNPVKAASLIGYSLMLMSILITVDCALWLLDVINEYVFSYMLFPAILLPVAATIVMKIKYEKRC